MHHSEPGPGHGHAHGHEDAQGHHGDPHHDGGHGIDHHGHGGGPLVRRFEDAEKWAKVFEGPDRDAWQKPAHVTELLQLRAGMTVADVGAGTGYFLPHLSKAVGASGRVLALDIEPGMVEYMRRRATSEGLANVNAGLVKGDDPGLAPASVDRVLIVDTWHHIPSREKYAARLQQALRPGGFVAIVDFTMETERGPKPSHRIPPDRAVSELEAGGLRAEVLVEDLPDQYVVIGRRADP
jgi:predicted methyltransferase